MIGRGFRRLTVTDVDLAFVIPMRFRPALFLRLLPPLLAAIPAKAAETALEQLARLGFREARLLGEVGGLGQTSGALGQT